MCKIKRGRIRLYIHNTDFQKREIDITDSSYCTAPLCIINRPSAAAAAAAAATFPFIAEGELDGIW